MLAGSAAHGHARATHANKALGVLSVEGTRSPPRKKSTNTLTNAVDAPQVRYLLIMTPPHHFILPPRPSITPASSYLSPSLIRPVPSPPPPPLTPLPHPPPPLLPPPAGSLGGPLVVPRLR